MGPLAGNRYCSRTRTRIHTRANTNRRSTQCTERTRHRAAHRRGVCRRVQRDDAREVAGFKLVLGFSICDERGGEGFLRSTRFNRARNARPSPARSIRRRVQRGVRAEFVTGFEKHPGLLRSATKLAAQYFDRHDLIVRKNADPRPRDPMSLFFVSESRTRLREVSLPAALVEPHNAACARNSSRVWLTGLLRSATKLVARIFDRHG